ncbi:MAG: efflux RND transporter permease subunit, partial [Lentisphaeria bacterium]
ELQSTWRNRVHRIDPVISENKARSVGITRSDVAAALQRSYGGLTIGAYREGDEVLPIIASAPQEERDDPDAIYSVQVWSKALGRAVPLSQIVEEFANCSEENRLYRQNRLYCLTIKCNASGEMASEAFKRVAAKLTSIVLPEGYSIEWGGEYESSQNANASLAAKLPMVGVVMLLILICLFNSVRQLLVISLSVPLGLIGVIFGLLVFKQPFGFMALLGILSLVGMQIKNAIVLIDEINEQRAAGVAPYDALISAGISRLRPVSMAALTTVLGMLPLVLDAFYCAMAVTIMCGLTFATVLTMIVVPVLYAVIFRIPPASVKAAAKI